MKGLRPLAVLFPSRCEVLKLKVRLEPLTGFERNGSVGLSAKNSGNSTGCRVVASVQRPASVKICIMKRLFLFKNITETFIHALLKWFQSE